MVFAEIEKKADETKGSVIDDVTKSKTKTHHVTEIQNKTKNKMLKEYEKKMGKPGNKRPLSRIPLWYFLHEILDVDRCRDMIGWENEEKLVFTIKKPKELAVLWGQIKNKGNMTYPKLARGIRYYYGKGVIEKFNGKRFCYQFIVSRKTKAVLSKRNNIPAEILLESKISTNRKRKSSSTDGSKIENKRSSWEKQDSDQSTLNGSEWGSDEDDMLSDTDIQNLDQCLADIFVDPQFSTFFSDSSSPLSDYNPLTEEKQSKDLFIMTKQPSELSAFSVPNNNRQSQQLSPFISAFSTAKTATSSSNTSKQLQNGLVAGDFIDLRQKTTQLFDSTTTTTSSIDDEHFDRRYQSFHESSVQQYNRDWNRQKSHESEAFLQGLFPSHNIHKPSSNLLRSIPDLSLIESATPMSSREETSFGFFTDFLLDESMHSSSIESYFDL